MKKFLALFIAILLVISLCACGGSDKKDDAKDTTETAEQAAVKGETANWGKITLLLPDGMTLVKGSLGNETDESALTLQREEDAFTYIMVSVNDESSIDSGLDFTKEINDDCEFTDVSYELSNGTFTGYKYDSMGYQMICLKGALSNGFVQITSCQFDQNDAVLSAVLESVTIAD